MHSCSKPRSATCPAPCVPCIRFACMTKILGWKCSTDRKTDKALLSQPVVKQTPHSGGGVEDCANPSSHTHIWARTHTPQWTVALHLSESQRIVDKSQRSRFVCFLPWPGPAPYMLPLRLSSSGRALSGTPFPVTHPHTPAHTPCLPACARTIGFLRHDP